MSPADTLLAVPGKYPLKITLAGHRGRVVVDLRYQYLDAATDRFRPGRRGITLPAAALPEIINALEAIKAEMVRDGALDEGNPPKFNSHMYPNDF